MHGGRSHRRRNGDLADLVEAHGVHLQVEVVQDDVAHETGRQRRDAQLGQPLRLIEAQVCKELHPQQRGDSVDEGECCTANRAGSVTQNRTFTCVEKAMCTCT